jgi:prepilin-type N-terminal cleavage/methylation domain-containing protein
MKRESGFTLIELLMVVSIIGILASMAVMSFWRSRAASNEASAIMSLRSISSGQVAFSASCGRGTFVTDLTLLGPQGTSPAFLSPDLTDAAVVQKSGFFVQLNPSAASVPGPADCNGNPTQTGFIASAWPVNFGVTGTRSFSTLSPMQTIWQVNAALAPVEPFVLPATPVR